MHSTGRETVLKTLDVDLVSSIMASPLGQRPRFASCHLGNSALWLGFRLEGHCRGSEASLKAKDGLTCGMAREQLRQVYNMTA